MAKVVKLKDRNSNPILPLTRSTVVEMNDGLSLQTAYDAINSTHYTKTEIDNASYISSSSLNTTLKTTLSSYATSANYDSNTKKIYLKHGTTTLSEIDATDFIKDGMVDTAYVQGANLVISFNTDAGKEAVNVPIADIFNANNYYTKSQIDANVIHITGDPNFDGEGTVTCAWEVPNGIPSNYTSILQTKIENYAPEALAHEDNYYCFEAISNLFPSGGTTDVFTISRTMYKALYTAVNEIDEELGETIMAVNPVSYAVINDYMNYTESDPTVPSYVKSITEQNITDWNTAHTNSHTHSNKTVIDNITSVNVDNWNSKTSNTGTITGITMNGESKGTSGVVDLGTVITSHQSLENYVTKSDLNSASYLQSFTETDPTVPAHVKTITQQNITDWNNKLSSETQLSINQRVAGGGNAITNISVSNHEISLTKGATFLTEHQSLANYTTYDYIGSLDDLTTAELNTIFN